MEQKISIIIPNYNHEPFLSNRMSSVLSQNHNFDQIFILDDASTDSSLDLLSNYKQENVTIICNDSNSGSTFLQWQKGLSLVSTDSLVWIAESDDFCDSKFLEEVIKPFSDPEVVLSYTRSIDINEQGNHLGLSYRELEWCDHNFIIDGKKEIYDHLYYQCTIPNVSSVVFRRSAVDDTFFYHNFKLCGDWYFYLKILQKGKVAYNSSPLNFHRFHQRTLRHQLSNNTSILFERLKIIKKVKKDYSIPLIMFFKSAYQQIRQYIFQRKITEIFNFKFVLLLIDILKFNPFFILILIYTLIERFLMRTIKFIR